MGMSFKVAPGVRVRASSRGLSAGVGPRAARVHVGTRGVGVSSGVGPVSGYTHLSSGGRRSSSSGGNRASYGPTKASIAARERELRQAEKEADIEKVVWLEKELVKVHQESFPKAQQIELPAPEAVDSEPIKVQLEQDAGIPQLIEMLGGGEAPPLAPDPEPVDRYTLMRDHRKRARQGISIFKITERIQAARKADEEAEGAAEAEKERRLEARRDEQVRLDGFWAELQEARSKVEDQLPGKIEAEKQRRDTERKAEQDQLDADWEKLQTNDPMTTISALEEAFADNQSPAAPLNCEGNRTTVVMQFSQPEIIVPERKPARTPGGKRTLKKRTKTEINDLYLQALGSNVLATVKETLAVAPGTDFVQMLVIRHETDGKHAGDLAAIYVGEFERSQYDGGSRDPGGALTLAGESVLNLKGKTEAVAAIDLKGRADLEAVLDQVAEGLRG
jgi:hypothetical protein